MQWSGALNERAFDRFDIERPALLRAADGDCVDIMLHNISVEGARFSCSRLLPIGSAAALLWSPTETWPAHVKWQLGPSAGIRFDRPIRADQLAALLGENQDRDRVHAPCD